MKTISVQVDDELWIQLQHSLANLALEMRVERLAASVLLRQLLTKWIGDGARMPFDAGWFEGYRAAYAAAMRVIQTGLSTLANGGIATGLEGIGMASPYDDRGGGE
jgi:hypothetical protein